MIASCRGYLVASCQGYRPGAALLLAPIPVCIPQGLVQHQVYLLTSRAAIERPRHDEKERRREGEKYIVSGKEGRRREHDKRRKCEVVSNNVKDRK